MPLTTIAKGANKIIKVSCSEGNYANYSPKCTYIKKLVDMKRLVYFSSFLITALFVISCNKEKDSSVKEVSLDFSHIEDIDLSDVEKINLELTDNSTIRRVDEFLVYSDKYVFVRSGSDLLVFDKDGTFKNKIGSRGNGPAEYTHFNSFHVKDNVVYIYDAMSKKMMVYDIDGQFRNSISLDSLYDEVIPNYIFPIANDKFIAKNTFGGDFRKIPSYSILDEDFHILSKSENRHLTSGITTLNNFSSSGEYLLFWEPLNDTIFSVTNEVSYSPKYFVNFHERSLPNSIKNLDLYEAMELSNQPENKTKYASLIRCASENEKYLRFIFLFNEDVYYVKYDKQSSKVKTYRFTSPSHTVEPLVYLSDDKLIVPINNLEDESNPSLAILDEDNL